jgi:hypothetical protein
LHWYDGRHSRQFGQAFREFGAFPVRPQGLGDRVWEVIDPSFVVPRSATTVRSVPGRGAVSVRAQAAVLFALLNQNALDSAFRSQRAVTGGSFSRVDFNRNLLELLYRMLCAMPVTASERANPAWVERLLSRMKREGGTTLRVRVSIDLQVGILVPSSIENFIFPLEIFYKH